jgi:DNA-directed RNA polymerase alpha subunit
MTSSGSSPPAVVDRRLAQPVLTLNLSTRAYNGLKDHGIDTVGDLISSTEDELHDIRNLGPKSVAQIIHALHARGLALKQEAPANQIPA